MAKWLCLTTWEFILNTDGVASGNHVGGGFIIRHNLGTHVDNGFKFYGNIDRNFAEARSILDGQSLCKLHNITRVVI